MLTITSRAQLRRAILGPHLRALLRLRLDQLGGEGADFHVVQPGDAVADAEAAVGWPLDPPPWDALRLHPGGISELVLNLSDDGPAQVLLVPPDADPAILALIQQHA